MPTASQAPGGHVLKAGSFKANASLTNRQWRFVTGHTVAGEIVICGAGGRMVGILQNAPAAAEVASIVMEGESFLVVDATTDIAVGDSLKSDAAGKGVVTTTAGDIIGAIAREAATEDDHRIRVTAITPRPYG
jgi:hypothetical protein